MDFTAPCRLFASKLSNTASSHCVQTGRGMCVEIDIVHKRTAPIVDVKRSTAADFNNAVDLLRQTSAELSIRFIACVGAIFSGGKRDESDPSMLSNWSSHYSYS